MTENIPIPGQYPRRVGQRLNAGGRFDFDNELPPSYDSLEFENSNNLNSNFTLSKPEQSRDSSGYRDQPSIPPPPYSTFFQHQELHPPRLPTDSPPHPFYVDVPIRGYGTVADLPDASHPRFNLTRPVTRLPTVSLSPPSLSTSIGSIHANNYNGNNDYLNQLRATRSQKAKVGLAICIFGIIIIFIVTMLQEFA